MALFTFSDLRSGATRRRVEESLAGLTTATASVKLANETTSFFTWKTYDIFLSHSTLDAEAVYGLKLKLEEEGLSVYVYWIDDPQARDEVDAGTAAKLRERMRSCKALLYASSENAANSKWMPWELGYFDGFKQKVAIVPIMPDTQIYFEGFRGQEYLNLYPYISYDKASNTAYVWREKTALASVKNWTQS